MDDSFNSPQKYRRFNYIRFISQIASALILMVLLLAIITYLNIYPVSFLSFLHPKITTAPTPTTTVSQTERDKILRNVPFLSCPIPNCLGGKVIQDASTSAYTIQFDNVSPNTKISAVIDGTLTKTGNTITIVNTQREISVKYVIKSSQLTIPDNLTTVKENQTIATFGSGPNSLNLSAIAIISKLFIHLNLGPDSKFLISLD